MRTHSKIVYCSIPVVLVILGISAFCTLTTLGIICIINYGTSNPAAWITIILGVGALFISIFFSSRIQLLQSHKNKKVEEKINKREKQRKKERKRARKTLNEERIFYITIPDRLINNETQSLPPKYEDVIKSI